MLVTLWAIDAQNCTRSCVAIQTGINSDLATRLYISDGSLYAMSQVPVHERLVQMTQVEIIYKQNRRKYIECSRTKPTQVY